SCASEPPLTTDAAHALPTSPESVLIVEPDSSAGPLCATWPWNVPPAFGSPRPPPSARLPAGHVTVALPISPGLNVTVFASIVASDFAEQIANTLKSRVSWLRLSTDATQDLATSPVAVFAVVPVSSTGPLSSTTAKSGLVGPDCPAPPPTARVPAGQSTDALLLSSAGTESGFDWIVASELAEQTANTRNSRWAPPARL